MKKYKIIEWQEISWNPTTGCTPISKGCANCYALPIAQRFHYKGLKSYSEGFQIQLHQQRLNLPFQIKKPSRIFVDSMSDLFHEDVPLKFIQNVFDVICKCPHHLFLIVTKRAELLNDYCNQLPWPNNLLMAVTVEHSDYKYRIDLLRETAAIDKIVFFEPLLDNIGEVDLTDIKWAFVGGESGPDFRPVEKSWIFSIKDQCHTQGCTFVFKQWGGNPRWKYGCELDGKCYDDTPTIENSVTPKIEKMIDLNDERFSGRKPIVPKYSISEAAKKLELGFGRTTLYRIPKDLDIVDEDNKPKDKYREQNVLDCEIRTTPGILMPSQVFTTVVIGNEGLRFIKKTGG